MAEKQKQTGKIIGKEIKNKEAKVANPSVKGMYFYINKLWKEHSAEHILDLRKRMIGWRAGQRVEKIERPTRIDKARALGYKAKKGFVIARVTIGRGGRKRVRINKKRKTKRQSVKKTLKMSYRWVAEERAQNKFKNLEVLNSYYLGKDGKYYFFEVILVDPNMPEIKSDKHINWICSNKNKKRVLRGLTFAAKKSRGLLQKSRQLKVRPSLGSWRGKGK